MQKQKSDTISQYKKDNFNRIWNKEASKSRDSLKYKVNQRGLEPNEKNCFEYYMGYIRQWRDRRGNVYHLNSFYNETFMRSIGKTKYGRPIKHTGKKKKQ